MNTLYLETLRSTVQVYHFFLRSVTFSVCFHWFTQLTARGNHQSRGVLKSFVNFIRKHLCWSLFLIKLQGWHLFWRTSAKNCFFTAHTTHCLLFALLYIQHLLLHYQLLLRSSRPEVFYKKGVLRVSFLIKLQGLVLQYLLFVCEFCKISKNTFCYGTPLKAASDYR